MVVFPDLLEILLHLDKHLLELCTQYGPWVYAILFIIIFCETGLVVTPFLPGDSLLFAAGALSATAGSPTRLSRPCWTNNSWYRSAFRRRASLQPARYGNFTRKTAAWSASRRKLPPIT